MPAHVTTCTRTLLVLATLVAVPTFNTAAPAVAQKLEHRLSNHVSQVAAVEHKPSHPEAPEDAARYIEAALTGEGYKVRRQQYEHHGHRVRNLEVSLINARSNKPPQRIFIVGAHYDFARGAPGANDNGSGMAAVLELARMLKGIRLSQGTELKFVFFVNEEPPCFSGEGTGSWQHASDLRMRTEPVETAPILDAIGSCISTSTSTSTNTRSSERYRPGLEKYYPNQGNFIAFVGTLESSELVRKTLAAFKAVSDFPAEGLVSASYVEGVTWSDHASNKRHGYPAIMITDTAFLGYPYYHSSHDTPGKLDYRNMALMVEGLAKVIEGIATPTRM